MKPDTELTTTEPTEFEVTAELRFRHSKLLRAVEQYGSIVALAKEIGIGAPTLGKWVNMKTMPSGRKHRRKIKEAILNLCRICESTPEELFPGFVRANLAAFETRTVDTRITEPVIQRLTERQAARIEDHREPIDLLQSKDLGDVRKAIFKALRTLSCREREVIKFRFGLMPGHPAYTLDETAHVFKVTRERIRQIEAKAMRKLEHPTLAAELVGFLDD